MKMLSLFQGRAVGRSHEVSSLSGVPLERQSTSKQEYINFIKLLIYLIDIVYELLKEGDGESKGQRTDEKRA